MRISRAVQSAQSVKSVKQTWEEVDKLFGDLLFATATRQADETPLSYKGIEFKIDTNKFDMDEIHRTVDREERQRRIQLEKTMKDAKQLIRGQQRHITPTFFTFVPLYIKYRYSLLKVMLNIDSVPKQEQKFKSWNSDELVWYKDYTEYKEKTRYEPFDTFRKVIIVSGTIGGALFGIYTWANYSPKAHPHDGIPVGIMGAVVGGTVSVIAHYIVPLAGIMGLIGYSMVKAGEQFQKITLARQEKEQERKERQKEGELVDQYVNTNKDPKVTFLQWKEAQKKISQQGHYYSDW